MLVISEFLMVFIGSTSYGRYLYLTRHRLRIRAFSAFLRRIGRIPRAIFDVIYRKEYKKILSLFTVWGGMNINSAAAIQAFDGSVCSSSTERDWAIRLFRYSASNLPCSSAE